MQTHDNALCVGWKTNSDRIVYYTSNETFRGVNFVERVPRILDGFPEQPQVTTIAAYLFC